MIFYGGSDQVIKSRTDKRLSKNRWRATFCRDDAFQQHVRPVELRPSQLREEKLTSLACASRPILPSTTRFATPTAVNPAISASQRSGSILPEALSVGSRPRSRAHCRWLSQRVQSRCKSWEVPGAVAATSLPSRLSSVMRRSKRSAASGPRFAILRSSDEGMPKSCAMRSTSPVAAAGQLGEARACPSPIPPPLSQPIEHLPGARNGMQIGHLFLLFAIERNKFIFSNKSTTWRPGALIHINRPPAPANDCVAISWAEIARRIDIYQNARAPRGR